MSQLLQVGENPLAIARARQALVDRDAELDALAAHAVGRWRAGDDDGAVAWAHIACHVGFARPGTRLTVPELETMLVDVGRRRVAGAATRAPAPDPRTVLHVMTESYPTGGHTRVVERWVARDAREATVVLTDQRGPLPDHLVEHLGRAGAALIPALAATDLLGKARELRALALQHDLVVLHSHMHDVVPVLALAEPSGRPPVIFFEHAAHQLWIGTGAIDVLACMRDVEQRIAREQRGFPAERIVEVPIPHEARALPGRAEARARLGLGEDQPLILSVASPWKVRAVLEPSFAEICDAVLSACPAAALVVVGPVAEPQWQPVAQRHGSRLALPGEIADIGPLLAAADVYLDSWPASGGTTIVDVAAAGLPIVSYYDGSADLQMLRVVATLGDGVVSVTGCEQAGAAVAALLADPARRAAMGAALRERIDRRHGAGWDEHLAGAVAAARTYAGSSGPLAPPPPGARTWQCLMELMQMAVPPTVGRLVASHAHLLPERERPHDMAHAELIAQQVLGAARADAGAPVGARAIAHPEVTATAIDETVARFRGLLADGRATACIVVLAPDDLREGMRLLQAALDAGGDLDVEIVTASGIDAIRRDGDVVVTADDTSPAGVDA